MTSDPIHSQTCTRLHEPPPASRLAMHQEKVASRKSLYKKTKEHNRYLAYIIKMKQVFVAVIIVVFLQMSPQYPNNQNTPNKHTTSVSGVISDIRLIFPLIHSGIQFALGVTAIWILMMELLATPLFDWIRRRDRRQALDEIRNIHNLIKEMEKETLHLLKREIIDSGNELDIGNGEQSREDQDLFEVERVYRMNLEKLERNERLKREEQDRADRLEREKRDREDRLDLEAKGRKDGYIYSKTEERNKAYKEHIQRRNDLYKLELERKDRLYREETKRRERRYKEELKRWDCTNREKRISEDRLRRAKEDREENMQKFNVGMQLLLEKYKVMQLELQVQLATLASVGDGKQ